MDSTQPPEATKTALESLQEKLNADMFIFSGEISYQNACKFIETVERHKSRPNVALLLTTFGGDAGSAYRIARFLDHLYEHFTLYVFGFCKSAGTIIALAADEIVMSMRGEFGPLDVQLVKRDEFTEMTSGLDVDIALDEIGQKAFAIFERCFLELKGRSGGAITTKTAAEAASSVTIGLLAPITGQIDPMRLGETQRAMRIAHHYGMKLNASQKLLDHLTKDYPTHDFVIDYHEAKDLFKNVRETNNMDNEFEKGLRISLKPTFEGDPIRVPPTSRLIMGPLKPDKIERKQDETKESPGTKSEQPSNGEKAVDNDSVEGHSTIRVRAPKKTEARN